MAQLTSKLKYAITICECLAFFVVGIILALLGPTLLDLADNTNATVAGISRAFTARSTGYLLGSIAGGKLFDNYFTSTCLVLGASLAVASVATFIVPTLHNLVALCFVISFQGVAMGMLDTGGNVLLLKLWGEGCGPYLQSLHAAFGVGAFLSPFIAQAYIANQEDQMEGCGNGGGWNTTASPMMLPDLSLTTTVPTATDKSSSESHISTAYAIAATLMIPVAIWLFYLHRVAQPALAQLTKRTDDDGTTKQRRPVFTPTAGYALLLIGCLFFFLYVGMEVAYGGYIFSYAVKNCALRFPSTRAARLTSAFWGMFALGRLFSIPLSMVVSPLNMTVADLAAAILAALLLVSDADNPKQVWFASSLFGLSLASIFPSGLHLLEQYIPLTGAAASAIVVGASAGEMMLPLVVGTLFGSQGPESFPKVNLAVVLLATAVFGGLMCIAQCCQRSNMHGYSRVDVNSSPEVELSMLSNMQGDDDEEDVTDYWLE